MSVIWDSVAQELEWYEPWTETLEGDLPDFKWFVNGISNPSINLLDRHIKNGLGNKTALIWESEDGSTKFYTYNMLLGEVNRFANALRSLASKRATVWQSTCLTWRKRLSPSWHVSESEPFTTRFSQVSHKTLCAIV